MADKEIRKALESFVDEIFRCKSIENAKDIKKRLDEFCQNNNVTFEQEQILAESGAGEALYMMTS